MVFEGPKPFGIIEKQNLFLILDHSQKQLKQILKVTPKAMFLVQNGDLCLPGSTYPLIFDLLV